MARKTAEPDAETIPEPEPTPGTPPPPDSRFFVWMRGLDLRREPGWIGGVCAGIAARLGIDPLIVRGIAVVAAILGGPALLLYAAAWLLLPDQKGKIHLEELFRGRLESPIAAIGALVLLSLLPVTQGFWYAGSAFWGEPYWGNSIGRALWTLAILAAIVWFVVWVARRSGRAPMTPTVSPATTDGRPDTIPEPHAPDTPPPAGASAEDIADWREKQRAWRAEREEYRRHHASERANANRLLSEEARQRRTAEQEAYRELRARTRPHPLFTFIVIGVALIAGGLVALTFDDTALDPRSFGAGLAVAAAVMGLGVIINGIIGRRSGGAGFLAVVALVPLLFIAIVPPSSHVAYVGGARFSPIDRTGTDQIFYAGVGDVEFDLRDFFADSPVEPGGRDTDAVTLYVGSGDVEVLLPNDFPVSIDASVASGAIDFDAADDRPAKSDRWWGETHFYTLPGDPNGTESAHLLAVRIVVGRGDITFEREAIPND